MHSIYYDSSITLAALDAKTSSEGLFLPKTPFVDIYPLTRSFGHGRGQAYIGPPTWNQFTQCAGPVLDEHQHDRQFIYQVLGDTDYVKSGLLETRAWAMQELRLSRRVLYFFHGAMMWRCIKAVRHQNGCHERPGLIFHLNYALERYEMAFQTVRLFLDGLQVEQDGAHTNAHLVVNHESNKLVHGILLQFLGGHNIQMAWFDLVTDYSDCQLTFLEDKLPGLFGVASRFQGITKDKYLAGHWRVDLDRSLFWAVGGNVFRAKSYRAPSWSWASIEGTVHNWDVVLDTKR